MTRGARNYFCACAALIGYALGYALPTYAHLPRAFYDPIARRWSWATNPGAIPMGYLGLVLFGVGGAAAAALVARVIVGRMKTEPSDRAFGLWAAWSLTALAIVTAYFTWNNWP